MTHKELMTLQVFENPIEKMIDPILLKNLSYHMAILRVLGIIALAHQECPADPPPPKNSIEAKKELPLIKRLESLESNVTLFVRNFDVPFDNNEAERAIRCVRIKTKSAGCFRGSGGEDYCTLMSYINTAWKHGVNAFKALLDINFQYSGTNSSNLYL